MSTPNDSPTTMPCAVCGAFASESQMFYGDTGLTCQACYYEKDTAQMWNKGITAQASAPIGLGLLSMCFNPFLIVTVITIVATVNCFRIALSARRNPEDLGVSSGQQAFLIIGGVIGIIFVLIRVAIFALQVLGSAASSSF